MTKYEIEYDSTTLATVEIDEPKAQEVIRQMVEFWMGWQGSLAKNNGNYTQTWLKNLGEFIILNGRLPTNDEGWAPLDGTQGINMELNETWRPDKDDISIEQLN